MTNLILGLGLVTLIVLTCEVWVLRVAVERIADQGEMEEEEEKE